VLAHPDFQLHDFYNPGYPKIVKDISRISTS